MEDIMTDPRDEALRACVEALKPFVAACHASIWHNVNGEDMKRVLVAPSAIARAGAALATARAALAAHDRRTDDGS
jgi:hypothetical protein